MALALALAFALVIGLAFEMRVALPLPLPLAFDRGLRFGLGLLTLGALARLSGDAVSGRRSVDAKSDADSCACVADGVDGASDDRSENEENEGAAVLLVFVGAGVRRVAGRTSLVAAAANRCSFTAVDGGRGAGDDC